MPAEPRIALAHAAWLVVDMQYGDAHRDYGLLKSRTASGQGQAVEVYARRLDDRVIPNIQRLQRAFRQGAGEVLFVRIESLTLDGRDRHANHVSRGIHLPPGSREGQVLDEVAPWPDEIVLSKTCNTAFGSTPLEYLLRNMARTTLVVVGVVTGSCVQATACDALARGFDTLVVDDATATWTDEMQQSALEAMRQGGATILQTDALLGRLI